MKRSISVFLCLALILSSFSFAFASPTSWDTSDQSNLQGILRAVTSYGTSNLYYYVSQIYSLTNTISNNINTIKGYLVDSGTSVAGWLHNINTWMSPILNAITSIPTDISAIEDLLYTDWTDSTNHHEPALDRIAKALTNWHNGDNWVGVTNTNVREFAHRQLIKDNITGEYDWFGIRTDGTYAQTTRKWGLGTPLGNIALITNGLNTNVAMLSNFLIGNFNAQQQTIDWEDNTFEYNNPTSVVSGLYYLLQKIQAPTARLSYVLASDADIEAREAAAANQEAVVDNFIDSTGDGSVPTSSFSDVSGLSSGVTSNLSTDASPAQIWDIFNSDHGSWFSQETANQLDTTTRTRGSEFETPLLDQQMEEIYKSLGGGN